MQTQRNCMYREGIICNSIPCKQSCVFNPLTEQKRKEHLQRLYLRPIDKQKEREQKGALIDGR